MTQEEKNRKLLEFAGFKFRHYEEGFIEARPVKICDAHWVAPDGEPYKDERMLNSNEPPNFVDPEYGLGWLFKWIVPKLSYWELSQKAPDKVVLAVIGIKGKGKMADGNTPAEALANAMLKWLEQGGKE